MAKYKRPPFPKIYNWCKLYNYRLKKFSWKHVKPMTCRVCSKKLEGRKRAWCSWRCQDAFLGRFETIHYAKKQIVLRDGGRCAHCKKEFISPLVMGGYEYPNPRKLELDHIKPLYKGGTHAPENLQLLCKSCHKKKTKADRQKTI